LSQIPGVLCSLFLTYLLWYELYSGSGNFTAVTDIQLLQIYSCYRYTAVTDIQLLQIYSFYRYTAVTDIQLLQIHSCYRYTAVTDIQLDAKMGLE